jgi:flagellar biosynthetic protein FlhB
MAEGSGGERTEKATPRRREKARRRGQVARSTELNSTVVLLAGISLLLIGGGPMAEQLGRNTSYLLSQAHLLRADNLQGARVLLKGNLIVMLHGLGPLLAAILVAGLAGNVLQVGFQVNTEALEFRGDRINPITGMKRFFNKRALFELIKNLLKIGLISLLGFAVLKGSFDELLETALLPLVGATGVGRMAFARLMYVLLGFLVLLALLDWAFQKWQHEESIKMTRAETRQELKDTEGDPQVKARVRGIQLEMARKRMLADVPKADVVVTNPDHLAVAIQYQTGHAAPRVVAKGRNHRAEIIKAIARKHRVLVLENKPVARRLYREVKTGAPIPETLYQVVAEILAYVYRLRRA